jgi:hypothetical protein
MQKGYVRKRIRQLLQRWVDKKAAEMVCVADEMELFLDQIRAQAKTKGRETVSEEMMELAFFAESMSVETGRIIPSPALAEAVIGGAAQIIKERDALRAERDAALAEAAHYKALWASVPWSEIICMADSRQFAVDQDEMQDALDILDWAGAHAPQPEQEAQP